MNIELQNVEARSADELERAYSTMSKNRADAIVVTQDAFFNANVSAIAVLAMKARLPSSGTRDFAEAGGVVGYGMDFAANNRRAARFVDKILRGAKPADLPVEQPTKFELIVNLKTAKALGLRITPTVLLRADQVIE